MTEESLTYTAYHEAGHAVASFFLNRPFDSVSIIPDENTSGRLAQEPYEGNTRSIIRKEIIISCAGEIAEILVHEDWNYLSIHNPSSDYDLLYIEDLAARIYKTRERRNVFLIELRKEAMGLILSQEWTTAINALAHALLKYEQLDYEQTAKVIRMSAFDE